MSQDLTKGQSIPPWPKKAGKTVGELFSEEKITYGNIIDIADESGYWQTCSDFILNNWDESAIGLTMRQFNWMQKILEDVVEWRIEGRFG